MREGKMKVGFFNTVAGGVPRFAQFADRYEDVVELVDLGIAPTYENLDVLKDSGIEGLIYYQTKREDDAYFKKMAEMGIKYLTTPSAGYDHYNLDAMRKYGIKGANVPIYSPNAISEHTVLLTLSTLRNFREQLMRVEKNDFITAGLMGREMRNMTIGIIGAGRIGLTTMKCLSGFGPKKMYACDPFQRDEVKQYAEYVSLEEIYSRCDVIIFHAIATDENYHMINDASIAKMKDGVVLINAARGQLFDIEAVIRGMESGKIGGLGLDVIEDEGLLKGVHGAPECPHPQLKKLLTFPNFTFTKHTAFFTDEANRNLTETCIVNAADYAKAGECPRELIK